MKHVLLAATLAAGLLHLPAQAQQVTQFTPERGFCGPSQGDGSLKILLGKPSKYHVDSLGQRQGDGAFRLDQTVKFDSKPEQQRHWLMHETTPHHYVATLSDASGPVSGETRDSELFLRFRVKGILVMHQRLVLNPETRVIDNVGRITFLGIPIGSLRETIRPSGSSAASSPVTSACASLASGDNKPARGR